MNYDEFNAQWLAAWTAKDAAGVASFYTPAARYLDAQVPQGLEGKPALRAYLQELFDNTPPMSYEAEAVWEIDGGFCGRWICTIDGPDGPSWLRGFDLCLIEGGKIAHNEVYTHRLEAEPG